MNKLTLSNGSSPRGAQMGRPNNITALARAMKKIKLQMVRLKWVDGDYDQGGAYWGRSIGDTDIYCAWGKDTQDNLIQIFIRAFNQELAKEDIREVLPNAAFFR
jgi:hypothetical protein